MKSLTEYLWFNHPARVGFINITSQGLPARYTWPIEASGPSFLSVYKPRWPRLKAANSMRPFMMSLCSITPYADTLRGKNAYCPCCCNGSFMQWPFLWEAHFAQKSIWLFWSLPSRNDGQGWYGGTWGLAADKYRDYSPIIFISTRLRRRPSNSP